MKRHLKRVAIFQSEFLQDLRFWVKNDRGVAVRVLDLVEAVMRDPFEGPGKPEPPDRITREPRSLLPVVTAFRARFQTDHHQFFSPLKPT